MKLSKIILKICKQSQRNGARLYSNHYFRDYLEIKTLTFGFSFSSCSNCVSSCRISSQTVCAVLSSASNINLSTQHVDSGRSTWERQSLFSFSAFFFWAPWGDFVIRLNLSGSHEFLVFFSSIQATVYGTSSFLLVLTSAQHFSPSCTVGHFLQTLEENSELRLRQTQYHLQCMSKVFVLYCLSSRTYSPYWSAELTVFLCHKSVKQILHNRQKSEAASSEFLFLVLFLTGFVGVALLIIYYIFKYWRIETRTTEKYTSKQENEHSAQSTPNDEILHT